MALELNDLNNQSPAYNKGTAFTNDLKKQVKNDVVAPIANSLNATGQLAKKAYNSASDFTDGAALPIVKGLGTGLGEGTAAIKTAYDAKGGSLLGQGLRDIKDFGRGALGIEPKQPPALTLNRPVQQPQPTQTMPKTSLSLRDIKANPYDANKKDILPNMPDVPQMPMVSTGIAPNLNPLDKLKSKPMQNIGAGIGAAPVQNSDNTTRLQSNAPQQQQTQPLVLSGYGGIGNSEDNQNDGSYINLAGRRINPNQQATQQANSTNYMDNRPDKWVNPLLQETGIDANKMAGGAFGGLMGLQMATAGMLPAVAHNRHLKTLNEQYEKDRTFATGRADKEAERQAGQATAQRQALENDRDFNLKQGDFGLRQNDSQFNQGKSLLQLEFERQKQAMAENNQISSNNLAWAKQAGDTETNRQKQELELKKLKRPVPKVVNEYSKPDFQGQTYVIGQSIQMVDPDTGKVVGQSDEMPTE